MNDRLWYEAEALMADSTCRCHTTRGASEAEVERWMMDHYPDAVAILVRDRTRPKARFGSYMKRAQQRKPT
jgi:hypothetical protein